MSKKMLIGRPKYDDITIHLHYWGSAIISYAKKRAVDFCDLPESKCNRKSDIGHITKLDPKFVVFHSHGDERTIYGHKTNSEEEVLIRAGENEDILKGRVVYSISCASSKILGRACSAQAFIGYKEDFIFYYMPTRLARPSTDRVAKPCLESTTQIPLAIIKGNSVENAVGKAKSFYINHIRQQIGSKELEAPYILQALIDNFHNLEVIGDEKAVF